MTTLKAHPDGALKAQGIIDLSNPTQFDGGKMTGSCSCCSQWPDTLAQASGIVDLEQVRAYDLDCVAHFPAWRFESSGGGASMTQPSVTVNSSVFFVDFKVAHPITTGDQYEARVTLTIGDLTQIFDPVELGYEWPDGDDVQISVSAPVRLFMTARDFGRYNYNSGTPTIWGPRGGGTDETIDIRGYISAELGWYYWPPSASGNITLTVQCFGETWSLTDTAGIPGVAPVGPIEVLMEGADMLLGDPAYLEASGFDAPDIPLDSAYAWHYEDVDGVYTYVDDRRVTVQLAGTDPSSARGAFLYLGLMQPPQTLAVQAYAARADGTSYPDGHFAVQLQDGPDYSTYTPPFDTSVNEDYPVADSFGGDAAVPIAISSPGTWQGTGEKYKYYAGAHFGSPWYSLTALDSGKDTIGDPPAIGFSYVPTGDAGNKDLEAQGQEPDAWRFPLVPQVVGDAGTNLFSWNQVELYTQAQKTIEAFTSLARWSEGTDTSTELLSGKMRVYGIGTPLVVQGVFDNTAGFGGARYIDIPCCGIGAARTAKLTIGAKEWYFDVPAGAAPQSIVLDMCAPFGASGSVYDSSTYEVGTSPGDWAWGVDDSVTMLLEFSGEVHVGPILALEDGQEGFILAGEAVHVDSRWSVGSGGDLRYVRNVLLYVLDGRVVLEEECGQVKDDTEDEVTSLDSLQTLCDRALTRQSAKITKLVNLAPATGGITAFWDWLFYRSGSFFNGRQPAWMLRPGYTRLPKDWDYTKGRRASVVAVADYQCDRVVAHPGVSLTMVSRRMIGGAIYGLLVEDQAGVGSHFVAATGGADTEEDYTEANGMFFFPKAANLEVATSYTISPESAATHTHQGCAARVGMVHT